MSHLNIETPQYSSVSVPEFGNMNSSVFLPKLNIKTPNSDFMSDSLIGSFNKAVHPKLDIPTPKMTDLFSTPNLTGGLSSEPHMDNIKLDIQTPSQQTPSGGYQQQYQTVTPTVQYQTVSPQPAVVQPEVVQVDVATPQSVGFTDSIKNMYYTTTGNLTKNKETTYWIVVAIVLLVIIGVLIISAIISVIDVAVDAVDAGVDAVGTSTAVGYLASPFTGIGDLSSEVVLEAVQTAIISAVTIFLTNSSTTVKTIKIVIVILCALIDILLSVITIVVPYVDLVETGIEAFTEVIQNLVLITNFSAIF